MRVRRIRVLESLLLQALFPTGFRQCMTLATDLPADARIIAIEQRPGLVGEWELVVASAEFPEVPEGMYAENWVPIVSYETYGHVEPES